MRPTSKPGIDINLASENELVKVLKISPRLARRIISLRPFTSFDQIDQIWGIDPQTLQFIHENCTFGQTEHKAVALPDKKMERIIRSRPIPSKDNWSRGLMIAASGLFSEKLEVEVGIAPGMAAPMVKMSPRW